MIERLCFFGKKLDFEIDNICSYEGDYCKLKNYYKEHAGMDCTMDGLCLNCKYFKPLDIPTISRFLVYEDLDFKILTELEEHAKEVAKR